MRQETKVREGGRTIISDEKPKDKKPATQPKPEVTKEDEKDAIES